MFPNIQQILSEAKSTFIITENMNQLVWLTLFKGNLCQIKFRGKKCWLDFSINLFTCLWQQCERIKSSEQKLFPTKWKGKVNFHSNEMKCNSSKTFTNIIYCLEKSLRKYTRLFSWEKSGGNFLLGIFVFLHVTCLNPVS